VKGGTGSFPYKAGMTSKFGVKELCIGILKFARKYLGKQVLLGGQFLTYMEVKPKTFRYAFVRKMRTTLNVVFTVR